MTKLIHPADAPLTTLEKGVPALEADIPIAQVGEKKWNLLLEDLPLPVAVLREDEIRHNSRWMRAFAEGNQAMLAPHGKTTMSPAIFDLQVEDGAWGITVATPHQLQVARSFGYKKIFYANQLIGRQGIEYVARQLAADDDFEFCCLVDTLANAAAIARLMQELDAPRAINVLVEVGYNGGRTGCRTIAEALDLAHYIASVPRALALRGIEGFEGLIRGTDNAHSAALVEGLMDKMIAVAGRCDEAGLFASADVMLSAGGSSYYDIVVAKLGTVRLSKPSFVMLRSGCYITHDSVLYVKAVDAMRERNPGLADRHGGLRQALEVWAYVQSRQESNLLIAALGKRDVSYDDLPVPLKWFRPGSSMAAPAELVGEHRVTKLNDQHAYLSIPDDCDLRVGDMIGFGMSHPCLTFDKWRVMHVVDDAYTVTSSIRTYF